ncbi:hypothetical protein [Klebsiella pneumoniae]|uniref:hypothetical protein n=1 Tax=Klebsiella pneumoniae TaxID=573 RepID=UPI0028BC2E30|nr:hypothetical protein [Klebsiella pneumoniae]MBB7146697.1 hypothetical protein [Escherichia coli]MEC4459285.1 hypothetical protein [Klebsiella pneumoniae]HBX8254863.1 hypothetical protein [Klebsiella pneumoniae]HDO7110931.1 hypothetical protein [Klebsiella pneumoniae]HDY9268995.1 hypothetical protein [Klebsiella pneumoniae]
MTERGMIFNAEMVRAILDGRKTQTRRIMKVQPKPSKSRPGDFWFSSKKLESMVHVSDLAPGNSPIADYHLFIQEHCCPFGAVGDRIWVRETWARYNIDQNSHDIAYRATTPADWPEEGRWRPSIHMPRWASRILLEITDVRVERLNAISEEDARAEGIIDGGCLNCGEPEPCGCANPEPDATDAFAYLWQSIYGQENWNANPWVWVIEFERVEGGAA